jgi:glucose-6-phosphate 1-epimerase
MAGNDIATLQRAYGVEGAVTFGEGPAGLVVADLAGEGGTARVALQGAQVLSFAPRGQAPVVWMGPPELARAGKSVRGGIPVCWPWFGPHDVDPACPSHGLVRTAPWRVVSSAALDDGRARVVFAIGEGVVPHACWPHAARLELAVTVGAALSLELTTTSTGGEEIVVGEAFHTYFHVRDIGSVTLHGLEGCAYLDKVAGGERHLQQGPITFDGELDRVYLGTEAECIIDDPGLERRIRVRKRGSLSTVVWNPWAKKAEGLGDLGPEGWRRMVCVESANALDNTVTLAPGASHTLAAEYAAVPP